MIRLAVRLTFWAALATVFLPTAQKIALLEKGLTPTSAYEAAKATISEIGSFCTRNLSACETGQVFLAQTLVRARVGFLTAYDGIRTQFDEPDGETKAATVPEAQKL